MGDTGLTDLGFVPQLIPDVRDEMEADLRATFFRSLPLGDKTLLGHLVAMVSERVGLLWEVGEQSFSAWDRDKATGLQLEVLSLVTGTFKPKATSSTVVESLCGDDGTVVATGSRVSTSAGKIFLTQASGTILLQPTWTATTSYAVGDQVTNSSRCYRCTVAGTSAGSGGPTTTADAIVDGGVTWLYLGEGLGTVDVAMAALDTGPIVAVSDDLTVIMSPASGWNSARNVLDAKPGRNVASDQELRLLAQAELQGSGGTTRDATRAQLLKLTGVISVTIFTNRTDAVDGNGLPPHSFECLVRGGVDQEIVDMIASNQPDGIQTFGGTSGTHTDSEGTDETINFSRPSDVNLYVDITFSYVAKNYPLDGDAGIKLAVVTWGDGLPTDYDAIASAVGAQAFKVNGVFKVSRTLVYTDVIGTPAAWIGTHVYVATPGSRSVVTNDGGRCYICITGGTSAGSGGPLGVGTDITDGTVHWRFLEADVSINARQLPIFDTSRISVHGTPVTP